MYSDVLQDGMLPGRNLSDRIADFLLTHMGMVSQTIAPTTMVIGGNPVAVCLFLNFGDEDDKRF